MPNEQHSDGAPGASSRGAIASSDNVRKRATADLVGRMPPYNEEAEQAVLACMMNFEDKVDDVVTKVQPQDFHLPRHAVIFEACRRLYQEKAPIQPASVAEELRGAGKLEEAGGIEYIAELSGMTVLGASGDFYADMVRSKSMQRQLINTCAGIMTDSYDTPYTDVEQLLDKAENSIFSIAENSVRGEDLVSVRDMLDSYFGHLEEISKLNDVVTGVTTGFPELDKRTAGLQPSDLIIIAARPSMGKTAFSLNLALNAAAAGKKVAFFSLEMSAEQLESRLISICSKVSLSKLRQPRYLSDDDWRSLYNAAQKLNCDLFIDDTPALRTLDLRAKARRMKSRVGLDLIVVDYLQLMRPSHPMASRELEISEISRTLKALAKELNIPVVALSQLNRKLEERPDKRPILSDLRESGAIEQDADVIMFIFRKDVYEKKKENGERLLDSPAEIIIGKQRNGPVGTVNLLYKCAYTSFESLAPDWMPEPSEDSQAQ